MRWKFILAGLIIILISSILLYFGVNDMVSKGYTYYPLFKMDDVGLSAFIYNTGFALIMMVLLGLVFRWKFKPSYYWAKTGEDYMYEYYEKKRISPTRKKIQYSIWGHLKKS